MMAVILANNTRGVELPQAGVVVAAHCDEVSGVGAEGAVPDPALVVVEHGVARQRPAFLDDLGDGAERVCGRG